MRIVWIIASASIIVSASFAGHTGVVKQDTKTTLVFQQTTFVSNAGESVDAEIATLVVPENRSKPEGSKIKLPVLRFKSTAAKPGSPIIYLAGGPGASGLNSAKAAIFPVIMLLRSHADVITFDQRGTGGAEPSLFVAGKLDLPQNEPLDSTAALNKLTNVARQTAAEIARRGIDLSSYNTNESADDVNDLRAALGADKITLWGHSYGSHLGLTVIRRHGEFVDRAILSGVNGPDQRWRHPNDLQLLIDRLDDYINKTPKLQRLIPSLKQTVVDVLKHLDEKPETVLVSSQPIVIGRKDVEVLVALQSGDLEFVRSLPFLFGSMKAGDYSQVANQISRGLRQRDIGTAMLYAMHIASGVSASRSAEIANQTNAAMFHSAINFPFEDKNFVSAWGVKDLGDEFRSPIKSNVPTLFMSGTLDGRTSLSDAKDVLAGFSNGRQLVIEGVAHDFYHLTPLVGATMMDFLDGKTLAEKIVVPFDLRGPDERKMILELRKIILEKGIEAGLKRLHELSTSDDHYLTSYVPGTLGFILGREDKKPEAALAVYQTGVEIFPENEFLNERLAEAYLASNQKALSLKHYQKCIELNSLNRIALLKVRQLSAAN